MKVLGSHGSPYLCVFKVQKKPLQKDPTGSRTELPAWEGGRFMPTFRRRNFWKHFAVPWGEGTTGNYRGFLGEAGSPKKRDVRKVTFRSNEYTQMRHVWIGLFTYTLMKNGHIQLEKVGTYSPAWERLGFGGRFWLHMSYPRWETSNKKTSSKVWHSEYRSTESSE